MGELENLLARYRLSDKEKSILSDIIISDFSSGITEEDRPVAIILGGQPGSGKSELTAAALIILKGNAVICNADEYRDYHPKAQEIKRHHEAFYPELTVQYSQPWNNQLRAYCELNKLNFILETTFSSGDLMNDTIRAIKSKGYLVYLLVLSVNKQLSFLGTRIRFEDMKAKDGFGRLVDKKVHDQKYYDVHATLEKVCAAGLYDKIIIYGRAGRQKVKGMKNGLIQITERSDKALASYLAERDKDWSDNDERYFNNDILYLVRQMVSRRASHDEIQEVLDVFQVGLGD